MSLWVTSATTLESCHVTAVWASSTATSIQAVPAHTYRSNSRTRMPAERGDSAHHGSERSTLRYTTTLLDYESSHGMALLAHTLDG